MEEDLVLWGGGNNSVKSRATDILGNAIDVMYIKSSGSDMKTIVPKQFPAVRLDYIAPLRKRDEEMSDQEMVDYLARCLVEHDFADQRFHQHRGRRRVVVLQRRDLVDDYVSVGHVLNITL